MFRHHTGFDMGIYQNPLIVTTLAVNSRPLFKLVLVQLVMDQEKPMASSNHHIFANQEFQSNRE